MTIPSIRQVLLLALALSGCASAPEAPTPLEEPFRVLLLGDSISMGYTPFVQELLAGRASVVRPTGANGRPENCEGTNKAVEELERWLAIEGGGFDVIHFNFGLHDLKRVRPGDHRNSNDPNHPHQADPERYGAQLRTIVARLQSTGARLVFATTTPVPEGELRPHREPADAVEYNRFALGVMEEAGVAVNDLFGFVSDHAEPLLRPGNVHFDKAGSRLLAERVVASVLEIAGLGPVAPGS